MKSKLSISKFTVMMLIIFIIQSVNPAMAENNRKIYDGAELLTSEEREELTILSDQYSEDRQVDIIILTTNDTGGLDIQTYMGNFYDEMGLGYDKSHGNTVLLTIDLAQRDIYIAGFYKGEEYLDNSRAESIREKITPDLSNGYYYDAFRSYIELSHEYLGLEPGVNPDNILMKLWFQLVVSISIAGIIVMFMVYRSGGRMTTSGGTYLDASQSAVTQRRDSYVRTDISKVKKPSNNNKGGGGVTGGGHSHSGSGGKF